MEHVETTSAKRLEATDHNALTATVDKDGFAVLAGVLDADQCVQVASMYRNEGAFRSRVVMSSHGFGRGEYKYFSYPLPLIVAELRGRLYPHVATIANRWNEQLNVPERFPTSHVEYLRRCHHAGQRRPTPLLLQYGQGDFNCLHQDLYGDLFFPLQAVVLLSRPDIDFEGGELVLTETSPSEQHVNVVPLQQGDLAIFPVRERPVQGKKGLRRAVMRHGVSRVRSGSRHTLGVIFHDSR